MKLKIIKTYTKDHDKKIKIKRIKTEVANK